MTTIDDVLAQIADALDDWDVGPDAMRCGAPAGTRVGSGLGHVEVDGSDDLDLIAAAFNVPRWMLTDEPGGRP